MGRIVVGLDFQGFSLVGDRVVRAFLDDGVAGCERVFAEALPNGFELL